MQSMDKKQPPQSTQLPAHVGIAACSFEIGGAADGSMQLFPAGTFDAPRGALRGKGPWRLDANSATRLIAMVSQRTNDIVVDYEHQSLLTAQNGQPVVAAGWIGPQTLEWREAPAAHPGLFAISPKWTAAASAHIAADEIRYVSPVFSYDAQTGDVLDILNVALTNNPAIDGMQAVTVAAASFIALTSLTQPESAMDEEIRERLLYVLNLPTLATDADIIAELDKAKALLGSGAAATSLLETIAAKDGAIAALTTQVSAVITVVDPTLYAPIAVVTELRSQLAALSAGAVDDRVEKLIEQGVADGRIIGEPAKAWLTDMGKKDIAALSSYLGAAQPIAALSGMQSKGKAPEESNIAALSATQEEIAVAEQLGLDPAEIVKQRRAK